ncbi:MAG: hypothetical protein HY541_05340, partial [Deltaproteobacteria bacterium]|nr:hypothetical protein [Deltaproteobacteria bacterium]
PETDTTDTDIGTDTTVLDVGTDTTPTVDTGLDEPLDEEGGSGASSFGEESEDTGSEGSDADSGDGGQGCSCFISSGNPVQAGLDALPFILLLLLPMVFRRKRPMARANG